VILVCAPTRTEARACRRGLTGAAAREVEVLRTGVGPARAAGALAARLRRAPRPALVVSSGFAGALTGGIPLHAVVTATSLHRLRPGGASPVPLPGGALRPATGAVPCALAAVDGVVIGGAAALAAPAAADMESVALAEVAAAAGVPVAILRVVTDTPEAPFPGFVRALGEALAAPSLAARLAAAVRAAGGALREPRRAVAFARSSLAAARALRDAWARGAGGLATLAGAQGSR
jgi:phosphorylase superfamily protein